jgi:hypothetical protein
MTTTEEQEANKQFDEALDRLEGPSTNLRLLSKEICPIIRWNVR